MSQASFDTHAAIRKLEKAGCPARQAEAMVSMVMQATGDTLQMARDLEHIKLQVETNMATKDALAALRTEMHAHFASLDDRFASLDARFASLDDRFASLDARFARLDDRFASLCARQEQGERTMVTKGELYRALWIQGGVLATLILTLAAAMLGFALYLLPGS